MLLVALMIMARYSCKFDGAVTGAVLTSDTVIADIYYLTRTFADVRFRYGPCDIRQVNSDGSWPGSVLVTHFSCVVNYMNE